MFCSGNLFHYKHGMDNYGIGNKDGILYAENPRNAILNDVFPYVMEKIGTLQNLWLFQVLIKVILSTC